MKSSFTALAISIILKFVLSRSKTVTEIFSTEMVWEIDLADIHHEKIIIQFKDLIIWMNAFPAIDR